MSANQSDPTFFDKIAREYAASPVKNEKNYNDTLDRTRKHLSASARVLEVGCGTGSTALKLASDVKHITATDIAPTMIEIAKEKAAEMKISNAEFAVGGVAEPAGQAGAYDAVLAYNLLHLIPDVPAALTSLRKTLKPGGVFISKTPGLGGNLLYRVMIPAMQFFGKAPYCNFFTIDELCKDITKAGFKIVETHDYEDSPTRRLIVARKE